MPPIFVTEKHIAQIEGKTIRTGQRRLRAMRMVFKKSQKDKITLVEYCQFMGVNIDHVLPFLGKH